MEALRSGTAAEVADVELVERANVEWFDIYDFSTGDHLMIWRVACREVTKHWGARMAGGAGATGLD